MAASPGAAIFVFISFLLLTLPRAINATNG